MIDAPGGLIPSGVLRMCRKGVSLTALELYADRLHARAVRVCEVASSLEALQRAGIFQEGAIVGACVNGGAPEICEPVLPSEDEPLLFWLADAVCGENLRVPDVRSLAAAAREAQACLVLDISSPTSFGCDPLNAGAPVCVECLRAGVYAVCVARSGKRGRVVDPYAERAFRALVPEGDISPACKEALEFACDSSYQQSLQKRFDFARAFAEYAAANPLIDSCWYPGLASHPDHAVAASLLRHGFGPLVSIGLSDESSSLRVFQLLGGTEAEQLHLLDGTTVTLMKGEGGSCLLFNMGEGNVFELIDRVDSALRKVCVR